MIAQGLPALGGALAGAWTPAGEPPAATLVPASTVSNTGWSAVGASTLHEALAAGDDDAITASTDGATARVALSAPGSPLTLTGATIRVRARLD